MREEEKMKKTSKVDRIVAIIMMNDYCIEIKVNCEELWRIG